MYLGFTIKFCLVWVLLAVSQLTSLSSKFFSGFVLWGFVNFFTLKNSIFNPQLLCKYLGTLILCRKLHNMKRCHETNIVNIEQSPSAEYAKISTKCLQVGNVVDHKINYLKGNGLLWRNPFIFPRFLWIGCWKKK